MPARLTAYLPDNGAASHLLRAPARVRIGRGPECQFRLEHPSVSRAHAELVPDGDAWRLADLGSKNGCFLDGVRIESALLDHPAWLRVGDIYCEFEPLSEEAADSAEKRLSVKRANSMLLVERLAQHTSLPDLLAETVRATVELADCERGFLLLADHGNFEVVASHGLDPVSLRSREFHGSVGAMQRSLGSKLPVVINDVQADAELAMRASVIAGGLRTLVCLPLLASGEVLGLVYADSRRAGSVITTMDLDLLRAFAERASLWIAARRGVLALAELMPRAAPHWTEIVEAQQKIQESA
ncbi:MAG: FHA domain-containing protein [Arenimonas sp.]|jgi:transcriptional regulator with GAF, ATPase, and Fis domain